MSSLTPSYRERSNKELDYHFGNITASQLHPIPPRVPRIMVGRPATAHIWYGRTHIGSSRSILLKEGLQPCIPHLLCNYSSPIRLTFTML
jgi:hypothetical protein